MLAFYALFLEHCGFKEPTQKKRLDLHVEDAYVLVLKANKGVHNCQASKENIR